MSKIYRSGKVIHRSKNLRGIRTHAAEYKVTSAYLKQTAPLHDAQPYTLRVFFSNGDEGISLFSDPIVAARFLNTCRSWGRNLPVSGENKFLKEYAKGTTL